jgi:hypothetical protein
MGKARENAPQRYCQKCDGLVVWTKGVGWEHADGVLNDRRRHQIVPVVVPQMPKGGRHGLVLASRR